MNHFQEQLNLEQNIGNFPTTNEDSATVPEEDSVMIAKQPLKIRMKLNNYKVQEIIDRLSTENFEFQQNSVDITAKNCHTSNELNQLPSTNSDEISVNNLLILTKQREQSCLSNDSVISSSKMDVEKQTDNISNNNYSKADSSVLNNTRKNQSSREQMFNHSTVHIENNTENDTEHCYNSENENDKLSVRESLYAMNDKFQKVKKDVMAFLNKKNERYSENNYDQINSNDENCDNEENYKLPILLDYLRYINQKFQKLRPKIIELYVETEEPNRLNKLEKQRDLKIKTKKRLFSIQEQDNKQGHEINNKKTKRISDTKWTLRHLNPSRELVELIPNSHVFIDRMYLMGCEINFNNPIKFARGLLQGIFNEEALQNCTLSGSNRGKKRSSNNEQLMRAGLDSHAVDVLIEYVKLHCLKRDWQPINRNELLSSLRSKLIEIRNKKTSTYRQI
nr:putative uncharacterized protein DDB_G0274405 [Helicoverpa armigera]